MDIVNLNSFLKFGYFLNYINPYVSFNFNGINKEKYTGADEIELIRTGVDLWNKCVSNQYNSSETQVVPLSGGLDSRAILASLLRHTNAENIHTYTFGTPGTYDYEIGNSLAKKLGTNHHSFNLSDHIYKQDDLIEISKRIDRQTLLFLHPPIKEVDSLYSPFNIWSGTIIDVFFGRHRHAKIGSSLEEAIKNFTKENIFTHAVDLCSPENFDFSKYIVYDPSTEGLLEREYVLDLFNRQLKFIAPHVLIQGFNYKTMLNEELINFAISMQQKYIDKQYLYKRVFLMAFPELFLLPTKSNFGLPLSAKTSTLKIKLLSDKIKKVANKSLPLFTNKYINYIDFDSAIRERKDLRMIVYENIMDLKQRKIIEWIDIENIWDLYVTKKAKYSNELLTLTSLEIHLKNGLIL